MAGVQQAIPIKFTVRWALDYADGKTRRGLWMFHDDNAFGSQASKQPREGLVKARIEAKELTGCNHPITVAEVGANERGEFRWINAVTTAGFRQTGNAKIIGLEMHTRQGICVGFYTDGRCIVENFEERQKRFARHDLLVNTPKGIIERVN